MMKPQSNYSARNALAFGKGVGGVFTFMHCKLDTDLLCVLLEGMKILATNTAERDEGIGAAVSLW